MGFCDKGRRIGLLCISWFNRRVFMLDLNWLNTFVTLARLEHFRQNGVRAAHDPAQCQPAYQAIGASH